MMGWNGMVYRAIFREWIDPTRVATREADRVVGDSIGIKILLTSGLTYILCQTFAPKWGYTMIVRRKRRTCHASFKREECRLSIGRSKLSFHYRPSGSFNFACKQFSVSE